MNKQQLAAKIWESANEMRSKIDANDYKDYILGFIFYKFISEQEVERIFGSDSKEELKNISEEDIDQIDYIKGKIGYFIPYNHLYSTWLEKGMDFSIADVRDALSSFNRNIDSSAKGVFEGVFDTLQTGLSKLGETDAARTKAVSNLIHLIDEIPMGKQQDYDVLGYVYEFLISKFAENAGKKAGEFYTPHEVSVLMSEIIATHLKERESIKIYDPTSGSGSLLINIGQAVERHKNDRNNIEYYAQELKANTFNLTRMNLVMRGVATQNIKARNADTLEDDWPINPTEGYGPLYVDAVVSNPPYSQKWDPSHKDGDPRYSSYGMAPKSKADYAFLLHDLYHMKPDGIMSIVLPHGVLFRGGEEGTIRKNLIEKNKIDAIIGLPANIFFGTGIPTIIMILKQNRENDDILIVDASKGFEKVGKNNKLRASDIRKIIDTVVNREAIEKYSSIVSKDEIRKNEYNLNIPRYVDSSEEPEHWDIYALMYGGIPKQELHEFEEYWDAFTNLREELFVEDDSPYVSTANDNLKDIIYHNKSVQKYLEDYESSMSKLNNEFQDVLLEYPDDIVHSEEVITQKIFEAFNDIPVVDKYNAYQKLADHWNVISGDLETIKIEGINAANKVNPNMVTKKVNGKKAIVQDGYVGHILPFDLVQKNVLQEDFEIITNLENNLISISDELASIIDTLTEEEKSLSILNDANDAFVVAEVNRFLKEASAELTSPEIDVLNQYIELLASKANVITQKTYIEEHKEVKWQDIKPNAKGLYTKTEVEKYINILRSFLPFESESLEDKLNKVSALLNEEKELKSKIKELKATFHLKTKDTIERLNELQIKALLNEKWIVPVLEGISELGHQSLGLLVDNINRISKKYELTYSQVSIEIEKTEKELCKLINQLDASEHDMKGLNEFQSFLKGDLYE